MRTFFCTSLLVIAGGAIGLVMDDTASTQSRAADKAVANVAAAEKPAAKPVETDMHEFMEYIYKPTYMRLRTSMSKRPSRAGWRGVKADSLIMAEGGNLLLMRVPEENGEAWKKLAVQNRELGRSVYQAAKKRDYDTARKHYVDWIKNCNQCHTKFAGGEHQLMP